MSIIQDLGIFGNFGHSGNFPADCRITTRYFRYFRHAEYAGKLPGMPELPKIPRSWICMFDIYGGKPEKPLKSHGLSLIPTW